MTNTYNTLNPLGSVSAKDLSDNASNFDEGMNSLSPSFYDRFKRRRETWAGMEKMVADFLESMGFEATHLTYVDGTPLTVLRPTQLFDRAGSVYKIKQPASFPVVLSGTWSADQLLVVDVGDQALRAALASSIGATMIGDGTKTVSKKLGEIRRKTIDEYFITGQTNWDAAFAAARADMNSSPTPMRLVFPAGVYEYTISPNWAKQDCDIVGEGEVRFRYGGTGNAFVLDAGPLVSDLVYNMAVGPFIIESTAGALDGAFIRSIHHSDIDLTVRGAGSTSAGIRINFAVCTLFKLTCSVNQEGWYLGAKPQYGVVMDIRNASEQTAYCTFLNPIMEGPTDGIRMPGALGNTFIGGTSEACTNGIIIGPNSYANKFYGIDLEANTTIDILCEGYENEFINVDSDSYCLCDATSHNNRFSGGNFNTLQFLSPSYGNLASGVHVNRSNAGGSLDVQGDNRNINCYNVGLGAWLADLTGPTASTTFSASITNNLDAIATLSVVGARFGMAVAWSYAGPISGLEVTAWVDASDVVKVRFVNRTGVTVVLGSAIVKVRCRL